MNCVSLSDKYILGMEEHEDGGLHAHCVLWRSKRFDVKRATYFDVFGQHPNIVKVHPGKTSVGNRIKYCKKDGDWTGTLDEPAERVDADTVYAEALRIKDKKKANAHIREYCPRDYFVHSRAIDYRLESDWKEVPELYVSPWELADFRVPAELREWLEEILSERPRSRTLAITGPSRTGKTCLARALGPRHMYMGQNFCLEAWDAEAKYLILDDIGVKDLPSWKGLIGCQEEYVITDKYCRKKRVKGMPCIWIGNSVPLFPDPADQEWWDANTIQCTVDRSLFM
jgi:hypothetical protein